MPDLILSCAAEIYCGDPEGAEPDLSTDGYDATFATNALGLQALLRGFEGEAKQPEKVVIVASKLERQGIIDPQVIKETRGRRMNRREVSLVCVNVGGAKRYPKGCLLLTYCELVDFVVARCLFLPNSIPPTTRENSTLLKITRTRNCATSSLRLRWRRGGRTPRFLQSLLVWLTRGCGEISRPGSRPFRCPFGPSLSELPRTPP